MGDIPALPAIRIVSPHLPVRADGEGPLTGRSMQEYADKLFSLPSGALLLQIQGALLSAAVAADGGVEADFGWMVEVGRQEAERRERPDIYTRAQELAKAQAKAFADSIAQVFATTVAIPGASAA